MKPMACVAVLLFCSSLAGDDAKTEREKLEGTWLVTAATDNGVEMEADQVKGIKVVFSGDEFSATDGTVTVMKGTFTLDPGKKPKAMDLKSTVGRHKGQTVLGVYELDGDTLRLCLVAPKEKRPEKLESTLDNSGMLLVCKRDK